MTQIDIENLKTIYEHLLQVKIDVINGYIMIDGMRALRAFIRQKEEELNNASEQETVSS